MFQKLSATSSSALCIAFCLFATGCLRDQNINSLGGAVQAPVPAPTFPPETDAFLHFSAYLSNLPSGSKPAVLNGVAYFAGADPVNGVELWRTDGTPAGTSLVKDLDPGADSSSPNGFVATGRIGGLNRLFQQTHRTISWLEAGHSR